MIFACIYLTKLLISYFTNCYLAMPTEKKGPLERLSKLDIVRFLTPQKSTVPKPEGLEGELNLPPSGFSEGAYRQLQRITSGSDILQQILQVYLETTQALLEALSNDFAEEDRVHIQQHAHALKSPSAQLGLMRMANLCKLLEDGAAGNSPIAELLLVYECITVEFEAIRPDLLQRMVSPD